ncbi:MAG: AtpZ/AtpI family protein [Nitrospira sp.]|nr:AtpZ/AtpI family protein [Nitrospira sp.]MCW5781931.1 AtpZ/AtpI family protein [Nitrospirales bacterium]
MTEEPTENPSRGETILAKKVGTKATRKLKAQRHKTRTVWFGLGMMGLVGWSVAIPTLLGAALGLWLDKRYPGPHSWTLALLFIGLFIGCVNAWHWVTREDKEIQAEQENHDE